VSNDNDSGGLYFCVTGEHLLIDDDGGGDTRCSAVCCDQLKTRCVAVLVGCYRLHQYTAVTLYLRALIALSVFVCNRSIKKQQTIKQTLDLQTLGYSRL